jgi:hypothetical protein
VALTAPSYSQSYDANKRSRPACSVNTDTCQPVLSHSLLGPETGPLGPSLTCEWSNDGVFPAARTPAASRRAPAEAALAPIPRRQNSTLHTAGGTRPGRGPLDPSAARRRPAPEDRARTNGVGASAAVFAGSLAGEEDSESWSILSDWRRTDSSSSAFSAFPEPETPFPEPGPQPSQSDWQLPAASVSPAQLEWSPGDVDPFHYDWHSW